MMQPALRSTPRFRDVILEQIRTVGLALRLPGTAAAVLFGFMTLLLTAEVLRKGGEIDFHPERWILPGVVGLLLPIGVWRGEDLFGGGFMWTLPMERRRHALARALAGWMWLIGGVAFFIAWLLIHALLSGGNVLAEETLLLVTSMPPVHGTTIDPSTVQTVRWRPDPLLWLVPFTAATVTYLFASALVLGSRHPLRWIVGAVLAHFLAVGIGDVAESEWLSVQASRLMQWITVGPYGLETVLVAGTDSLKTGARLSTGEAVSVWWGLPDIGDVYLAALIWIGAGLAAVWLAASRHRERRRS